MHIDPILVIHGVLSGFDKSIIGLTRHEARRFVRRESMFIFPRLSRTYKQYCSRLLPLQYLQRVQLLYECHAQ